jgi:hypothetical protein
VVADSQIPVMTSNGSAWMTSYSEVVPDSRRRFSGEAKVIGPV